MPACQPRLGATMQMEQRLRLIDLGNQKNAMLFEDDFDCEYRFGGRPTPGTRHL
jgi:GntR family transcriptional regulator/MocR family aminotransferase